MPSASHSELIDDQLHVAFRWVQEMDPGSGADHPGHYWLKLSTGDLKRRKDDDSGWDAVGGGGDISGEFTAAGDLLLGTGVGTFAAVGVGADGYVLTADSGEAGGVSWQPAGGGGSAVSSGVYASRPAAGTAGNVYYCTDAPVVYVDNGVSWDGWKYGQPMPFLNEPTIQFNVGTAVVSAQGWGTTFSVPANGSTGSVAVQAIEKAYPGTPFVLDMAMSYVGPNRQYAQYGFMARDSGSGRIVVFGPVGGSGLYIQHYNSATSVAGSDENCELSLNMFTPFWIRFEDDGTNIKFSFSADGINWVLLATKSRTFWLATPDKIGFFMNNQTGFIPASGTLLGWYEH